MIAVLVVVCVCVCVLGGWGVVFDLMEGYLYGEVLNNHQPEVDSLFFLVF